MKQKIRWIIEICLFFLLSFPLSILPLFITKKIGKALGMGYYFWNKKRRNISIENIKKVRALLSTNLEPYEIAMQSDMNLGISIMELIKIYFGRGKSIMNNVLIEGIENYERAKAKGKGVIFFTGHCGNWELLALSVGKRCGTIGVVGRPTKNPYLYKIIVRLRGKFGNIAIDKKGALRGMLRLLGRGECVGILIDQAVLPEEGYKIDFLGFPAWTTKTPVLIAKRTSSPLLPAFIKRQGNTHKITIYPEIELTNDDITDTKKLSSFIEEYIKENPTEWLWIHRRWKRT